MATELHDAVFNARRVMEAIQQHRVLGGLTMEQRADVLQLGGLLMFADQKADELPADQLAILCRLINHFGGRLLLLIPDGVPC